MNTGLLRYAVGTVLTVYGIETLKKDLVYYAWEQLEQCLPFTVLKQIYFLLSFLFIIFVGTVLTVYGIETVHIDGYRWRIH